MADLFERTRYCLLECDVDSKLAATQALYGDWRAGRLSLTPTEAVRPLSEPGRPARPRLVTPRDLPARRLGSASGHASFIHALAHIEFNAVNLALDAVYRFCQLPRAYYGDWLRVAAEEAGHFELLRTHLRALGHDYGDFDAHDGLWDVARRTAEDPLRRMALVPRVMEARGLDVTPGMIERLSRFGDATGAEILQSIWSDEIGHVEIGTRWFRYLCRSRGLDPDQTFAALVQEHSHGRLRGPFHQSARQRAGFSAAELRFLETCKAGN